MNYGGIEQQQTPSGAPLEVSSSFANIVRDGEQPGPSYVEQTSAQLPNEDSEGGLGKEKKYSHVWWPFHGSRVHNNRFRGV